MTKKEVTATAINKSVELDYVKELLKNYVESMMVAFYQGDASYIFLTMSSEDWENILKSAKALGGYEDFINRLENYLQY